jgi:hypothetical protein
MYASCLLWFIAQRAQAKSCVLVLIHYFLSANFILCMSCSQRQQFLFCPGTKRKTKSTTTMCSYTKAASVSISAWQSSLPPLRANRGESILSQKFQRHNTFNKNYKIMQILTLSNRYRVFHSIITSYNAGFFHWHSPAA